MKISKIEAGKDYLRLYTDGDGEVTVRELTPVIGEGRRLISETATRARGGVIEIGRQAAGRDRIYSRFSVMADGAPAQGVCYVTDIARDVPENSAAYPQPQHIKMVAAPTALSRQIGNLQSLMNINLPNIMTTVAGADTISFEFNGQTYFFIRSAVEAIDSAMRGAPMTTMILLNSPRLFGSTGEKALLDRCIHPRYDWNCDNAYISAFDMETEQGQGYFGAFVEFLVKRYTRPDGKYGRAVGAIISNEVNSQYIWGNAGEMPMESYVEEYAEALRLAWICGRKHCAHFRVYISLDQFWCGVNFNPAQTGRYYSGRAMLEELNRRATEEGNFDWAVAYHPYPEDLRWPDFWHDRAPDFTFSTPKITFKNMEVLEAFLAQPQFLIGGRPRRIIFSEQGFNSHNGELQALTEKMAAAGYVLAYLKARNMKTVDLFTHHACVDNPHEFGLNLGMFRYDPEKPDHVGEPKPIFASYLAMESAEETQAVEKARAFIGAELFDYLLNPPLTLGDRDASQDNEFGN